MTSSVKDRAVMIETAAISWQETGEPYSEHFGDLYFSASGGLSESRHVFLKHNQLAERFARVQSGDKFVIAETGFGTGLNFLATIDLWERSGATGWLDFISFERYPLSYQDLTIALARWPELSRAASALLSEYPPAIAGVHRLVFPEARVRLTLFFGDAQAGLDELPFTAQAWFLDGFNPRLNTELWNQDLYQRIASHSGDGTTFATYSAAGDVRRGLGAVGFDIQRVPGHKPKREMLRGVFGAERSGKMLTGVSGVSGRKSPRRVIVVGAGLAGSLVASNLAQRGVEVTVIESGVGPGSGASGNKQGALYVKLGVDYTPQSELALAALVYAQRFYQATETRIDRASPMFWHPTGLLLLATNAAEAERQRRFLDRHQYPTTVFKAVTPTQASSIAGMPLGHPGLHFPGSGWLAPQRLCEALCSQPGVRLLNRRQMIGFNTDGPQHWVDTSIHIASNDPKESAPTEPERLYCDQLILCPGASGILSELGIPARQIRGQISWWPADILPSPACVICGDGYINPSDGRSVTLGATFDLRDADPSVRDADHKRNLDTVARWLPALGDVSHTACLSAEGRTGFRCTTPDYQPLAGILSSTPQLPASIRALVELPVDEPEAGRGLAILAGLGSKGLAYGPLLAEWLCDRICGGVPALPLPLAEIVHPQRFALRARARFKPQSSTVQESRKLK